MATRLRRDEDGRSMAPLDVHRRTGQVRQWPRDVYGFVPMIRDVSHGLSKTVSIEPIELLFGNKIRENEQNGSCLMQL